MNDKDPKISEMAFEPPPEYSDLAYSTVYFLSSELERKMFLIRKKRNIDVKLSQVMQVISKAMGIQSDDEK